MTYLLTQPQHEKVDSSLRADWLAARALARLALGRTIDAARDADLAVRLAPSPGRLRARLRLAIATGHESELAALDPDDVDRLPAGGRLLGANLRAAAEKLRIAAERAKRERAPVELTARMSRAALSSALGDHTEALAEADRAAALGPLAVEAWLLRARACRRAADAAGAMAAVKSGLALAPGDPRLHTLRGRLLVEEGRPVAALATLDRAIALGASGRAHSARAEALWEIARYHESLAERTLALRDDPEDADAFVERARCFARLGRWEPALADLESAVDWSYDRPTILTRVALLYASCLTERPNRLSRVLGVAFRAMLAYVRR